MIVVSVEDDLISNSFSIMNVECSYAEEILQCCNLVQASAVRFVLNSAILHNWLMSLFVLWVFGDYGRKLVDFFSGHFIDIYIYIHIHTYMSIYVYVYMYM